MDYSHYHAFELTEKGLELRQLAIAGSKNDNDKICVVFTKGAIGQGRPTDDNDIFYMTSLVDPVMDVPVKESYADHVNHVVTVVVDNTNIPHETNMTEIGVFAKLINPLDNTVVMGEILYGYTYTDKYDYIPMPYNYVMTREISFNTVLSKADNINISLDNSKVYVTEKDLEDHNNDIYAHAKHALNVVFKHNLNNYPNVVVMEVDYGFGFGGYGGTPFGGVDLPQINCHINWIDTNAFKISLARKYDDTPELEKVNDKAFIVRFNELQKALFIKLFI